MSSRDFMGMARWRGARTGALLLGLTMGFAASMGPANAEKVGVAAAVNPDAFSSLSGTPDKQLKIGKSIFYNERINTTTSGLVQVLLVDGSTFTVGPNSDLVIDKFVYNPKKKTGQIIATFSKGTMRFIGGKLSKNAGGVTVKTPGGALAIRGGMFQGNASRGVYSFLYGHSLTFRGRGGQTQTIYEPGYTLDLSRGTANVRPTTAADTNAFMQALSSGGTNSGSGAGSPTTPAGGGALQQANNLQEGASELISNANTILVQTEILQQLANLDTLKNEDDSTPPANSPPATGPDAPTPEPVIKNGGTFTGYSSGFRQTGENGTGMPEFLGGGTSQVVLDPDGNTVTANININHAKVTESGEFKPVDWLRQYVPIPNGSAPDITLSSETVTATNYDLDYFGQGDNAYIDDDTFFALADDGTTTVVRHASTSAKIEVGGFEYEKTKLVCCKYKKIGWWRVPYFYPVTETETVEAFEIALPASNQTDSVQASHTGSLASIPDVPLCEKCDFLKFGFWGSDVEFGENIEKMGGWWVASNAPVTPDDLPISGGADYAGLAVGTFAKDTGDGVWQQGVATGDLTMDWNFASRKGNLAINNFGNELGRKSFGGEISAPISDPVNFAGALNGINGAKGFTNGSFVGPRGTHQAPAGVMGNFGVGNNKWRANGIYGGGIVPTQP